METSTVTSKGQTTIPAPIRKQLNLKPGDRLIYRVDEHGNVLMRARNRPIEDLRGPLRPVPRFISDEENERRMAEGIARENTL